MSGRVTPIPSVEVPAARAALDVCGKEEGVRRLELSGGVHYRPDKTVAVGEIWDDEGEPWWFAEEIDAPYQGTRMCDQTSSHQEHAWIDIQSWDDQTNWWCPGIDGVVVDHDPVNHPKHYTAHPSGVECIEITRHMNFNLGNVVKYVWRAGQKDEAPTLQDLKKAAWYLNDEIERREKEV